MKIEKISESKLKVIVTLDDMIEWNLTYETMLPDSPDTYLFFENIINTAKIQTGAEFENCKLTARIIKKDKNRYIIFITKNELEDFNSFKPDKSMVFIFDKFDDVKLFVNNNLYYCFLFDGKNSLFSLKGKYFLILENDEKLSSFFGAFDDRVCEYAKAVMSDENEISYLNEHGKCIVKDSALKIIYFKM